MEVQNLNKVMEIGRKIKEIEKFLDIMKGNNDSKLKLTVSSENNFNMKFHVEQSIPFPATELTCDKNVLAIVLEAQIVALRNELITL